jgi:hypothetical protein
MAENSAHLVVHARLRPVGMLVAQARRLHFARRPVKLFGQAQPPRASHGAQGRELFGAGLFIHQHKKKNAPEKWFAQVRANDGKYMKSFLAEALRKRKQEAVENFLTTDC